MNCLKKIRNYQTKTQLFFVFYLKKIYGFFNSNGGSILFLILFLQGLLMGGVLHLSERYISILAQYTSTIVSMEILLLMLVGFVFCSKKLLIKLQKFVFFLENTKEKNNLEANIVIPQTYRSAQKPHKI